MLYRTGSGVELMTHSTPASSIEEFRLEQQARYAQERQAFKNRELLNTLNSANQTLNNLYLLEQEENK